MEIITIDVLMTCHNRREQTISCLNSLFQFETDSLRFEVYLVDDGSQDLTKESVNINFPKVDIIYGKSLLDGSEGHGCDLQHCGVYLMDDDEVARYKAAWERDGERGIVTVYHDSEEGAI